MEFGNADYYIIGELVACWGSFLICVNIFLSFSLYDRRQRLFLYAAVSTLLTAVFNIASVYCIASFGSVPIWLNYFVATMYFLLLLITPYGIEGGSGALEDHAHLFAAYLPAFRLLRLRQGSALQADLAGYDVYLLRGDYGLEDCALAASALSHEAEDLSLAQIE